MSERCVHICTCAEMARANPEGEHVRGGCVWCVAQGKRLGAELERAVIVTWLRSFAPFSGCDANVLANDLEKGLHLRTPAFGVELGDPTLHKGDGK